MENTNQLIGCCGLDCETCDARIATLTNDNTLREKTAALWTELNGVPITAEMINCTGCRMEGANSPFVLENLKQLKQDMPDTMTVNDVEFRVIKLLGKGKGGYSYLVTDETTQYVLKQIHYEPCEYYTFGDKLNSELRDYETLHKLGIPMPRLLEVDTQQERILKEYIAGKTVVELLKAGQMESDWFEH